MTPDDFNIMQKSVRKAKRIASEKAGEMHDLVEDRLPSAFEEIPKLAQETYDACLLWSKAEAEFQEVQNKLSKGYKG